MIEALNQPSAREGLRDKLGRRLSSQFLRGHAVGIGHIDDDLPLPDGQRLRDIRMRFETDSQKDDVRRREKGGHRSYLRRIGHALERIERGEELHTLLA